MTKEQNVRAILESNFAGFREDIIEYAVDLILALDEHSKMVTDKEAIDHAKALKEYCRGRENCIKCPFDFIGCCVFCYEPKITTPEEWELPVWKENNGRTES